MSLNKDLLKSESHTSLFDNISNLLHNIDQILKTTHRKTGWAYLILRLGVGGRINRSSHSFDRRRMSGTNLRDRHWRWKGVGKSEVDRRRKAPYGGHGRCGFMHLLLGLVEEDRDPAEFLGSDITIDAAREAVRRIWQNDEENGNDTVSLAQSKTSVTDVMFSDSIKCIFGVTIDEQFVSYKLTATGKSKSENTSLGNSREEF
ncbi:unnamed protein product [Fraxinus pennsylvanica]|uniref:Uncharacterized protein n=1 Tax=Fraxinus pennsylvanica TaxID=56036 RepID=A0AAD2EA15_9LAMI|nr:unnamed protein product [Fraxinus pennsylvanica]